MSDDQLSQVFAALADPTRRDIVARLAVGDATVGQLAAPYDVSIQAISKHLKVLEDAGLVSQRPGRPAASAAPRSRGLRPDDQLDRPLPAAGRRERSAGSTLCSRVSTDQTLHDPTRGAATGRKDTMTEPVTRNETRSRPTRRCRPSRIVREFDASPAQVCRAWIDPELFVQWIGPRTSTDPRSTAGTPGPAAATATPPARAVEEIAAFYGSFHEIRPGERLVQTFTWEGMPDGVSLETMTFTDLGDGRTRMSSVVGRRHPGGPGRDARQRDGGRRQRGLREARRATGPRLIERRHEAVLEMVVDQTDRLHQARTRWSGRRTGYRAVFSSFASATDSGEVDRTVRSASAGDARPRDTGASARRTRRPARRPRRALSIAASILARFRTIPASAISRSTSASSKAATRSGSKPANASRKFSRLRRIVIQDSPDWNASRRQPLVEALRR